MSLDSRLLDKLTRCEQLREQGVPVTDKVLRELCASYPELVDELKRAYEALRPFDPPIATTRETQGSQLSDPYGPEHETPFSSPLTVQPTSDPATLLQQTSPTVTHCEVSIPGYEVLERLGRGGMGVVYRALQLQLNRAVALKMVRAGEFASSEDRLRFLHEAEAIGRLQHPNFVHIYEVGHVKDQPYFTMEYLDGGNLARTFAGKPQPVRNAAQLVETLARAVHAAHERGVIHRDLKPANVLLTADGMPKIADFGLAKLIEGDSSLTQSGAIVGTPSYMAPEQASGKVKLIGPAADIYALGAILYEALTGRPPFQGETTWDTLEQLLHDDPVPPRRLLAKIPRDLETICLKCLTKQPERRYSSALTLAEELRRFLVGEPIHARPAGVPERAWRWSCRKPAAAALVVVLGFSIAAVTGLILWNTASEHERRIHAEVQTADALTQEARALWLARRSGWRRSSLGAIQEAATIRATPELRDIAFQTLADSDFYERHDLSFPGTESAAALTLSPDGKELAVANGPVVQLWDFPAAHLRRQLTDGDGTQVTCLRYSPDGTHFVYGGKGGEVHVLAQRDAPSAQRLAKHEGAVQAVTFGPGSDAVSSTDGSTLEIWELSSGKRLVQAKVEEMTIVPALPGLKRMPEPPPDADLHPKLARQDRQPPRENKQRVFDTTSLVAAVTQSFLILATEHRGPFLWHFAAGKLSVREKLNLSTGLNVRLALNIAEDRLVLVYNSMRIGAAPMWRERLRAPPKPATRAPDYQSREPVHLAEDLHYLLVHCGLQTPQPETAPAQPTALSQEPQPPPELAPSAPTPGFRGPDDPGILQALSARQTQAAGAAVDGVQGGSASQILSSMDARDILRRFGPVPYTNISYFDMSSRSVLSHREFPLGAVRALTIAPSGLLMVAGDTGYSAICRPTPGDIQITFMAPLEARELSAATMTSDAHTLISARGRHALKISQIDGKEHEDIVQLSNQGLHSFAVNQNQTVLATAQFEQGVEFRDALTAHPIGTIELPSIYHLAFSGNGHQVLAVADATPGVYLVDVTGTRTATPPLTCRRIPDLKEYPEFKPLTSIFSPDSRWIVLAGRNPAVLVRHNREPDFPLQLSTSVPEVTVENLSFSGGGHLLAGSTKRNNVYLWETGDWRLINKLPNSDSPIFRLAFSPTDRYLAAGHEDGKILIWDVEKQETAAVLDQHDEVFALAWGPERYLVTGGGEGTITLWDVAAQARLTSWKAHRAEVVALAFSHDGHSLLSCAKDGEARWWRLHAIRSGLHNLGLDW